MNQPRPPAWEPSAYGTGVVHYFLGGAVVPLCGNGTRPSWHAPTAGRTCRECTRKLVAALTACAIPEPAAGGRP